jgi:predicted RNA methylase
MGFVRQATAYRARLLSRVLIELGPHYGLDLPHASDVSQACVHAYGPSNERSIIPMTELLGVLGAYQWRLHGVWVPALGQTIHPHYGVFAPTRQEYLDLVAAAPWPRVKTAFDIGTGTGVIAALLAHRGAEQVVATDIEARAVACASDNVNRLGFADRVQVEQTDLFPARRADLVVCNPPWLPAVPTSPLDAAIYDPASRMVRRFLQGLSHHLAPGGEAWLILSDLAELLGLRTRREWEGMVADAGLCVVERLETRPRHRTHQRADPLAEYRAAEITSLWRLNLAP